MNIDRFLCVIIYIFNVYTGHPRSITQYFFNADAYFRFCDDVRRLGVDLPIVPGIMPVGNYAGIQNMAKRCGAVIPRWMIDLLAGLDDDPEVGTLVAASIGRARAMKMALLAERLPATEAYAAGLISSVHPAEELDAVVREAAQTIARNVPLNLRVGIAHGIGVAGTGMPGFNLPDGDLDALTSLVRSFSAPAIDANAPGDRAAGAIKSGGTTRRAAKMVCLDLDHPEIEDFVD